MKRARLVFQVPSFEAYTEPRGRLVQNAECQALFYYCVLATENWKREDETLVLEGEPDISPHYERLFRNAALMYGANIEQMANYWPLVDREIDRQNVERVLGEGKPSFKKLPERFRFSNRPITVKKAN